MTNWLTTHYPHQQQDTPPWHIYLQQQHRNVVKGIAPGDRVFFYEYAEQKPLKGTLKHPRGRQGIVRVAKVSGSIRYRNDRTEYADGTIISWCWEVPVENEDVDGFVKRKDVLEVLGYKPGSYLRGFNAGTGVMQLSDEQARRLMELFKTRAG